MIEVKWAQPGPISDDHLLWALGTHDRHYFARAVRRAFGLSINPAEVSYSARRYEDVDGYT